MRRNNMGEKCENCIIGYMHTPPYIDFVRRYEKSHISENTQDVWECGICRKSTIKFNYCPCCGIKE